MILELNDLRIFTAVAEEGSMSRAASRLNYVQSNVTARIRQMENRLGVSLFIRQSRGVNLTSSGRRLREYALRILALATEAERVVQEKEPLSGVLTIGSMETTAAIRLPAVLVSYHGKFPDVDLRLLTGTSEELLRKVIEFDLDAALVGGKVDHPDLFTEEVFEEELVLASPEQWCSGKRKHTVLVFRRGCSYRERTEAWLRSEGLVPYRVMEYGSVDGIIACVRAGMGMTALPRPLFSDISGLRLTPLPPEIARMPTLLVRRTDSTESSALREFVKLLKADAALRPK